MIHTTLIQKVKNNDKTVNPTKLYKNKNKIKIKNKPKIVLPSTINKSQPPTLSKKD